MARLSRRTLMVGATGIAALGCAGAGSSPERGNPPPPPPEPSERPRLPSGEPGTLFRVDPEARSPNVRFAEVPEWFRALPGLWCPYPRSAGASLLTFAEGGAGSLCQRLRHFRELPALLDQAERQGTNLLYLTDWYQGAEGASCTEFIWNKGDYEPRSDLGGADGLREGIAALHRRGGRVLLYVEPFVFEKGSPMGRTKGEAWAIRTQEGFPDHPYPDSWKLCPANAEFRSFLVGVARKVFRDYGADGIHLDSFGYQREWACVETAHGHRPGDPEVFDEGCKTLCGELLAEARKHMPDAVIMMEGTKFPALFRWVSACQDWGIHSLAERWAWRAAGHAPVFSAGWSIDDIHQLLALGHRLTIGGDWALEAPKGTLTQALDDLLPAQIPDKKDERFRRFFAEDAFRRMHRWRNAALLLGKPVPNIDACCPRRWDRPAAFESHAGLVAILEECRQQAALIDRALADAGPLPSLEAHYKRLMDARAAFQAVVHRSEVRVVETRHPHVAAYLFDGPGGAGATAVNVADETVEVSIRGAAEGSWRELVKGGTARSAGDAWKVSVPPHSLRMWKREA